MPMGTNTVCNHCHERPFVIDGLRAYACYAGPLRNAIHRLKYQRDIALGETLAGFLVELYREVQWEIDLVVAVPLGVVRRRERGYNQAALIAYPLSLAIRVPYGRGALQRVRETASQVDLSFLQRLENVKDAFWADAPKVAGRNVLVIDDVTTTGATINACAEALKKAGANTVYGFVVARTILSEGGRNDRAS
ncbi:MAG: amidophosphoribosyltransferase [Anaerolineae bacterium]|jgi:ComF family protein|nr:MAG: amidophosphoribosyltransferase [Anaerolineae bacterium]